MGLKVSPPNPTRQWNEILDNNFKFFDNYYCLVLENDYKISHSLFLELDNIANVLMNARDQIIVSVEDPDEDLLR